MAKAVFILVKVSQIMPTIATYDCTCHGHLGRCDTDRIISICIVSPKVTKASKEYLYHITILLILLDINFANVNEP
jgi:hypothetical protein